MNFLLTVALLVYSVNAETHYLPDDLEPLTDDMIKAINDLNSTWQAGKNYDLDKLIIHREEKYDIKFPDKRYPTDSLPKTFDAREAWPNCPSIGKIYDQRKGYPSWIYTAVGSVADRLCIQAGVQIDVEATVDRMMKSTNFISANIGQVFNYWLKNGIFTVELPKDPDCTPFSPKCKFHEMQLQYYNVFVVNAPIYDDKMSAIMIYGPLPAYLNVHSDFPSYKSGVYKIHSKKNLGMHNVKIIGWGTSNGVDYWLATNSWGSDWGDNGIFKISRGTGEFGGVGHYPSALFTPVNDGIMIKSLSQDQLFYLA